jgi:predicted ATPase/DNA-binding SARP family transcriptional activator
MEFRILGPLEVAEGDRQVPVSGVKERALLAILLIHTGEVVSADRLIDELWGSDLPANPSNALQVVVSRLRRALQGELVVTRQPGYLLDIGPEQLDARRFERLVEEARQVTATDPSRSSSLLEEALGLWRGPALAEFAFERFAQESVARLHEARTQAVELKMEADLALGRHAELVGELRGLVAGNPLRERLRGQLMLALYRSGRQGEALRVFQEGRKALVEELGVDPGPELQELHQQILLQAASLAAAPEPGAAAPRNNLPAQVTSFVGRDVELQEVRKALERSRLVTLTGPGGCGKTRLALETAGELLEAFPDGVWLAELEAVSDPGLVPRSLGSALGIRADAALGGGGRAPQPVMDKLIHYLATKQLLVVVDNCEHLIDACAQVAERVLRSAPGVRILATSRERLGVDGEVLWPVPPLGLPRPEETTPEQLAQHDAVRLFVDRASAVQPSFVLDAEAAPAVHHICRRLDGMPLALELAAARVRVLPPLEIAARLEDHFGLLVSATRRALPRHQTLRAAIDWSYGLLSEPERDLFGRLSVFTGGFTLEAAEEVCGNGEGVEQARVLELLSRLVDQSLVVPPAGSGARFRMLETLHRYAAERLAETGTVEVLQRRHAAYLLRLVERAEPLLRGPEQGVWLGRLESEHDNVGAALDWALGHDPETAVRLSSALAYFWLVGRHRSEVRRRLDQAVEASREASSASRARVLAWAAVLGCVEGKLDQAASQAAEAYELSRDVGDPWWVAMSEAVLGLALGLKGDVRGGGERMEEARARFAGAGDEWGAAITAVWQGLVPAYTAQHEQAAAFADRARDGFRAAGDRWGQTMALELQGMVARRRGAYEDAVAAYEEALGVVRDLELREEVPFLLVDLGNLQVLLEHFEAAAVLHEEALALALELGVRDTAAHARNGLGLAARGQGNYGRASELHLEALSFFREAGFTEEMAFTSAWLGFVEELRGDLDAAETFHRDSLLVTRELFDELPRALALEGLACVAAARRQPQRAAVLLGAAASIRDRAGTPRSPQERVDIDRATDAAVRALGQQAFTGALAQGRRMNIQEAAGYALAGDPAG